METTERDIKHLNHFLRGELSAVATYEQCIATMDDPSVADQMRLLRESHRRRADTLREHIRQLGGHPSSSAGVWGTLTKALEGSARIFGAKAAITVLEEGEEHGKDIYEKSVDSLSLENQQLIREVIYPEQQKSRDVLVALEQHVRAR